MSGAPTGSIGGPVSAEPLSPALLDADPRNPTRADVDALWPLFVAIGDAWHNTVHESAGLRSGWLDFLTERCTTRPSYVAEYASALEVLDELRLLHGDDAYDALFFRSGVNSQAPALTRLAHAKTYVVDEFIRVQIVVGGFTRFITPEPSAERPDEIVNHRGFLAGSRYNRVTPVRAYIEGNGSSGP